MDEEAAERAQLADVAKEIARVDDMSGMRKALLSKNRRELQAALQDLAEATGDLGAAVAAFGERAGAHASELTQKMLQQQAQRMQQQMQGQAEVQRRREGYRLQREECRRNYQRNMRAYRGARQAGNHGDARAALEAAQYDKWVIDYCGKKLK